jgi:hypothetical protein
VRLLPYQTRAQRSMPIGFEESGPSGYLAAMPCQRPCPMNLGMPALLTLIYFLPLAMAT